MIINDLPSAEKPRERLIQYGASNLSTEDLLAIILRTGIKNLNVKELSSLILTKIKAIEDLANLTIGELTSIRGLGTVKAITLLAALELGKRVNNKEIKERVVINNTDTVHEYFSNLIGSSQQEEILTIFLDYKKRLISYKIMYKGTDNSAVASVKEIYNYAIKENASGLIIMHNHPSGILVPSEADIKLTNDLIEAGKIIGIPLLDHLITNGKEYYSFFQEELVANET